MMATEEEVVVMMMMIGAAAAAAATVEVAMTNSLNSLLVYWLGTFSCFPNSQEAPYQNLVCKEAHHLLLISLSLMEALQ